ncbi:hypothetical protein [Maricaulis parjimensis]|uniref:hypothetical protein n=1 Tax=Maricaulis parjimensis TaxID=144023 RepID=UPI001939C6BC|nr:hypothetical protein [Maricaulis parjimensis]
MTALADRPALRHASRKAVFSSGDTRTSSMPVFLEGRLVIDLHPSLEAQPSLIDFHIPAVSRSYRAAFVSGPANLTAARRVAQVQACMDTQNSLADLRNYRRNPLKFAIFVYIDSRL